MENYNVNQNEMWSNTGNDPANMSNYYEGEFDYNNLQSQQFDFHESGSMQNVDGMGYSSSAKIYNAQIPQYPELLTPDFSHMNENVNGGTSEFDEPPLLEELEIYPDRILEKTLAVLNPFRSHGLADDADFLRKESDLAGPIAFCLGLAILLFVAGNKVPFGYVYGLSVVACLFIYFLLNLMTINDGIFTFSSVASVLGYCLLPIVGLSVFGVFVKLDSGALGILVAILIVIWSSLSASRLFIAMSGDKEQRPLIAYPCALVYGVFALLVIF